MKPTMTAIALSLTLIGASAQAAETTETEVKKQAAPTTQPEVIKAAPKKESSIFKKLDANNDGKVSPQEAQVSPALVKGFNKIDSNKDGFLSADEFSQLQVEAAVARTYLVAAISM